MWIATDSPRSRRSWRSGCSPAGTGRRPSRSWTGATPPTGLETRVLPELGLDGGYGYWGSLESMPGTTVAAARLLTADGRLLASATFGS